MAFKLIISSHNDVIFYNLQYINKFYNFIDAAEFTDEIHKLQIAGVQHFSDNVQKQIDQIKAILNNQTNDNDGNYVIAIKNGVDKCLKHIGDLKTDWNTILPKILYKKAIGQIMNSFCNNILKCVLKLREYSADVNIHLITIMEIIQKFGQELFEVEEIKDFVASWTKIEEFLTLFSLPLDEVEKKWLDATKPLSLLFHNLEIQRLIKLIFPKSENREAFLLKFSY